LNPIINPYAHWSISNVLVYMFAMICMKSIWIHTCWKCSIRQKFLFWDPQIWPNTEFAWLGGNLSNIKYPWFLYIGLFAKIQKPSHHYQFWRHRPAFSSNAVTICGGTKTRATTHSKPKHSFMPTKCVSMKLPRKNNPSIEMKVDLNSKWGKTPKEILH